MKIKIFNHGLLSWVEDFIEKHPVITPLLVWTNPLIMFLYWIYVIISLTKLTKNTKDMIDEIGAAFKGE